MDEDDEEDEEDDDISPLLFNCCSFFFITTDLSKLPLEIPSDGAAGAATESGYGAAPNPDKGATDSMGEEGAEEEEEDEEEMTATSD